MIFLKKISIVLGKISNINPLISNINNKGSRLKILDCSKTSISSDSFEIFENELFKINLKELYVGYTKIDDEFCTHVARHFFNLKTLDLKGTRITKDGLQTMLTSKNVSLDWINIEACRGINISEMKVIVKQILSNKN